MIERVAAEIIIGLRDEDGSVGRLVAHVGGLTDVVPARSAALQLAERAAAISGCAVATVSITWETIISDQAAPPGPPAAGRAVFVFGTDQAEQLAALAVPGVLDELVEDGEIDPEQPAVAAFVASLIDGIWANPFGFDITTLEASYYEFKP